MVTKRKAWMIGPAKKPTSSLPDALKAEVETKANDLIANALKPKHVQTPPEGEQFNYISDIGAKWYGHYFYFVSTYTCPGPNALSPTFEEKFARMEYIGDSRFVMYFMRHNGEWVGIYDALSVDVPIIHFHGTDDEFAPFKGGKGKGVSGTDFYSVEHSIQAWVKANGCKEEPVVSKQQPRVNDGTTIICKSYGGGKEGSEVVLIEIVGGGHTWPGEPSRVRFLGKTTMNISANDAMWEFFQKHPMK